MTGCPRPIRDSDGDIDLFQLSQGDLPMRRRIALRAHMIVCSTCRSRFVEFRSVASLLSANLGGGPGPGSGFRSDRARWPAQPPPLARFPMLPIGFLLLAGLFSTVALVWTSRSEAASPPVSNVKASGSCVAPPPGAVNAPHPSKRGPSPAPAKTS